MKHQIKLCPSKFKCKTEGCGLSHHTLLHKPNQPAEKKDEDDADKHGDIPNARNNATRLETSDAVLLLVITGSLATTELRQLVLQCLIQGQK